ncbi:MAG: DUF5681 domain-containing protein [Chthoniobacteraceae bacterium]
MKKNRKKDLPTSGYDVGYGKPPKHSQFQKGQSGNPAGRPKKRKSRQELFEEAWQSEVNVNGKMMTKAELFVHQLVNDGIKGKAGARNLLMGFLPDAEGEKNGTEEFDPDIDDKIALTQWMCKVRAPLSETPADTSTEA